MKLRLIKGRSYYGAVFATAEKPIVDVDDEAKAQALIGTGYFKAVTDEEESGILMPPFDDADDAGDTGDDTGDESHVLEEMSKSELETAAAYHNVDIKGLTKKADIIAAIKEAVPEAAETGTIEYGSPTITELQDA